MGGEVPGKALLVPMTLTVSAGEGDQLEGALGELSRAGIEVSRSGPNTFLIREVPELLSTRESLDLVSDWLSELSVQGEAGALADRLGVPTVIGVLAAGLIVTYAVVGVRRQDLRSLG